MNSSSQNGRLYRLARKLKPILPYGILANLAQWFRRNAHEPDFEVFDLLADMNALVLDVGASRGQSALSILRRTRYMRVLSIEPNTKHRWGLMLIAVLHPFRFRFQMTAAGAESNTKTLHIPGKRASGLSSQGSLDPQEFDKDYVQARLSESGFDAKDKTAFRRLKVKVRPLDQLALSPQMIKLDVEGYEAQTLEGLSKTLRRGLPALLIEVNNTERWIPGLSELGYHFYQYDNGRKTLSKAVDFSAKLNLFCIHPDSDGAISQVLIGIIEK